MPLSGYELRVTVVKGEELLPMDSTFPWSKADSSDPFVTVSLGNKAQPGLLKEGQTRVIDKSLNPVWNETVVSFVTEETYRSAEHLVLRIYDHDMLTDADEMGQVAVSISEVPIADANGKVASAANPSLGKEFRLNVEPNPEKPQGKNGKKRAKGMLTFAAMIVPIGSSGGATPAAMGLPATPSDPANDVGGALDSSELRALAKILRVSGQLAADGIVVRPPKICVIGGQSAGKSTIFNVILKEVGSTARFPTDIGTCTKVPTILSLFRGTAAVHVSGPGFDKEVPYGQKVDDAVREAQRMILAAQYPGYEDSWKVFSDTPVQMSVATPQMPTEIVLVDTPGLISEDLPQGPDLKAMITRQIQAPNCLIVAAGKADLDDDVDLGMKLAQRQDMDPSGSRTLRAHTFWKFATAARQQVVRQQINSAPLDQRGHIVDLKQDALGQLVSDTVEGVPPENSGTQQLVKRLAKMLGPIVRRTRDQLEAQFNEELKKVNKELDRVGRQQPDEGELIISQIKPLKEMLLQLIQQYRKNCTEIGLEVKRKLTDFNGDSIQEMDIDYWGPSLDELPLFQGYDVVKKVVRNRLQAWIPPVKEALAQFYAMTTQEVIHQDALVSTLGLPRDTASVIAKKWDDLAHSCIEKLKTKLIPPDGRFYVEADGKRDDSMLEKLWKNPPSESVYIPMDEREINEQLNPSQPSEVLQRYREDPNGDQILQKLKEQTDKFSYPEVLDITVDSFKRQDMKDVPQVAKVTVIVRDRIRIASRHWVGYYDSQRNKVSGAMGKFLDSLTKEMLEELEAFKDFTENDIYKKWCTGAMAKDPYAEEREKLLNREDLIKSALRELSALGGSK